MRVNILPYKQVSESAKLLRQHMQPYWPRKIYISQKVSPKRVTINWGSTNIPAEVQGTIINRNVVIATNKIRAYQALVGLCPPFTTDKEEAKEFFSDSFVVERHVVNGHSGRGIRIVKDPNELSVCPVYVKYVKKLKEFRVHVFKGEVIYVQEKRKREGWQYNPNYTSEIRSHANGWVFCTQDLVEPASLRGVAIAALDALALDFGAVDIIWNKHQNTCYVLEVNTAPGLCDTTASIYANKFNKFIGEL